MIKILTKADRERELGIFVQMFQARAEVFQKRLGWDAELRLGLEFDGLDLGAEPVYIVIVDDDGKVVGSLRMLSAAGPMLLTTDYGEQFRPKPDLRSGNVWECSRFCISPTVRGSTMSSQLLFALCKWSLSSKVDAIVGCFDIAMQRVYARIGWVPRIVARSTVNERQLLGQWDVSHQALDQIGKSLKTPAVEEPRRCTPISMYRTMNDFNLKEDMS